MSKKKLLVMAALYFLINNCYAQDSTFAKGIIDVLTSTKFHGRGYTNNGMLKSADFIKKEFKSYGLTPINDHNFLQPFYYSVNTFPAEMSVSINGKNLIPGQDFIVSPESSGLKATGSLIKKDSLTYVSSDNRFIVKLENKLTWSVSETAADYTLVKIDKEAVKELPETFKVNIRNKVIPDFEAINICGLVKGTDKPDSVIFITAHYDHLGEMGKRTYFPGANDNASGTALLLSLAKYYGEHPPKYSIGFICFAGEEAGLKGSKYYTENPLTPLSKIKFLINTDLAGTGQEGITVVNGSIYKKEFEQLVSINKALNLVPAIKSRGKAANSDHYWFSEKGVPAFFI